MEADYEDKSNDRFSKIVFSVVASLIVSGIIGLWALSTQVSRIEERVKGLDDRIAGYGKFNSDRIEAAARQIDQIAKEHRDSDRRIGVLEGRVRVN